MKKIFLLIAIFLSTRNVYALTFPGGLSYGHYQNRKIAMGGARGHHNGGSPIQAPDYGYFLLTYCPFHKGCIGHCYPGNRYEADFRNELLQAINEYLTEIGHPEMKMNGLIAFGISQRLMKGDPIPDKVFDKKIYPEQVEVVKKMSQWYFFTEDGNKFRRRYEIENLKRIKFFLIILIATCVIKIFSILFEKIKMERFEKIKNRKI